MKPPLDILIAKDGRIFAHNLTPALAAVLAELNPGDEAMRMRADGVGKITIKSKITNRSRTGTGNDEPRATNE